MLKMKEDICVLDQLRNAGKYLNDIWHYYRLRSFHAAVGKAAISADPGCH
jgi:hypothetical protein